MLDFSKFDFRFLRCSVVSNNGEGWCESWALWGTRMCHRHTLMFEHLFEKEN